MEQPGTSGMRTPKIKVLLELRPALEGFAGIPQEVRLLFRGLRTLNILEVEGMLQTYKRPIAKGLRPDRKFRPIKKYDRLSKVIISIISDSDSTFGATIKTLRKAVQYSSLQLLSYLNLSRIKLTQFDSTSFEDFTWRTLFSKSLPASDFRLVSTAGHRICSVPWNTLHKIGLATRKLTRTPLYPLLDTRGFDVFIGQTPYPARINAHTAMVIRYHDAIPVFMPHTIPNKSFHQASHLNALSSNAKSGAWFACVSESTRQDLLKLVPEASGRAVTIHNMVSHHYFYEDSPPIRVPEIIRSNLYLMPDTAPSFRTLLEKEFFYQKNLSDDIKYLLIVSTIEPRKNHARIAAAWDVIRSEVDPDIKLVIVGSLGWDCENTIKSLRSQIDRGGIFMLNNVPAPALRVLYRHAKATVCPSLSEGFDFSGVESMRSGGVTVASDIPVHREIYGDAAEYFDPYSTTSTVNALKNVLYSDNSTEIRETLRLNGETVSSRYLPERLLPQWADFLSRVTQSTKSN